MRKLIEKKLHLSSSGCTCLFVPIFETIGIKLYEARKDRDFAHAMQQKAYKQRLAPKPYGKYTASRPIIDEYQRHYQYGYLTQIATHVGDADWSPTLDKRMKKAGFSTIDTHACNIGRIGRRMVCIDFDMCSMTHEESNDENVYPNS